MNKPYNPIPYLINVRLKKKLDLDLFANQVKIKMKSHIMSTVTSVHLRTVRCHQFKKRHHMRLLLKVFADLEKVFSLK